MGIYYIAILLVVGFVWTFILRKRREDRAKRKDNSEDNLSGHINDRKDEEN